MIFSIYFNTPSKETIFSTYDRILIIVKICLMGMQYLLYFLCSFLHAKKYHYIKTFKNILCLRKTCCSSKWTLEIILLKGSGYTYTRPLCMCTQTQPHSHTLSHVPIYQKLSKIPGVIQKLANSYSSPISNDLTF